VESLRGAMRFISVTGAVCCSANTSRLPVGPYQCRRGWAGGGRAWGGYADFFSTRATAECKADIRHDTPGLGIGFDQYRSVLWISKSSASSATRLDVFFCE